MSNLVVLDQFHLCLQPAEFWQLLGFSASIIRKSTDTGTKPNVCKYSNTLRHESLLKLKLVKRTGTNKNAWWLDISQTFKRLALNHRKPKHLYLGWITKMFYYIS